jgi:hypothetical protein
MLLHVRERRRAASSQARRGQSACFIFKHRVPFWNGLPCSTPRSRRYWVAPLRQSPPRDGRCAPRLEQGDAVGTEARRRTVRPADHPVGVLQGLFELVHAGEGWLLAAPVSRRGWRDSHTAVWYACRQKQQGIEQRIVGRRDRRAIGRCLRLAPRQAHGGVDVRRLGPVGAGRQYPPSETAGWWLKRVDRMWGI